MSLKVNRKQSLVVIGASVAVAIAGFLVYKTFPHLGSKQEDGQAEEKAEQAEQAEEEQPPQ